MVSDEDLKQEIEHRWWLKAFGEFFMDWSSVAEHSRVERELHRFFEGMPLVLPTMRLRFLSVRDPDALVRVRHGSVILVNLLPVDSYTMT